MSFIDVLDEPSKNINIKYNFLDIIFLVICTVLPVRAGYDSSASQGVSEEALSRFALSCEDVAFARSHRRSHNRLGLPSVLVT
ncbi:hypothetical protein XNA1_3140006 [Xenorhabdus nematophila str. Anatoliense]|nr:hypothetical protein XNA1_3140006 [Xenorhabdus nematophila str. Anatoliense]